MLITINLDEVAEVVDEAITRHSDLIFRRIKQIDSDVGEIRTYIDGKLQQPAIVEQKVIDQDSLREEFVKFIVDKIKELPVPSNGRDGKDGRDGHDGIGMAGAIIDRNNELIITLTDGTTQSLGIVVGRDGVDGKDGRDGIDGKNGLNGEDGLAGRNGVDGKDGQDGLPGKDGIDGIDGKDGKDGKDGLNGEDGSSGRDGIDGKDGVPGLDGKDGLNGKDGAAGINGKDGAPGVDGIDGRDGLNGDGVQIEDIQFLIEKSVKEEFEYIKSAVDKIKILSEDDVASIVRGFFIADERVLVPRPDGKEFEIEDIPETIAEKVAKAIAFVAESPIIVPSAQTQPVIVNVTQSSVPLQQNKSNNKRVTTSRDAEGNLIAEVSSISRRMIAKKDSNGNIIADILGDE